MTDPRSGVLRKFQDLFGAPPEALVRAPGRVNLIGDHTDYNDGFVLPMAIDRGAWIALRRRVDARVELFSLDYNETIGFDPSNLKQPAEGWRVYVEGVGRGLVHAGHALSGWEGVIQGDIPIGAGLSSSAALELAAARAFAFAADLAWDPVAMARLAQAAENDWVGVRCGIMDQMISANGRAGHVLLIDCRSLALQLAPLRSGVAVVVMDTATRRGLQASAYNDRRDSCERAASILGVRALRDVQPAELERRAGELDALTLHRAWHVVTENERVLVSTAILNAGAPGWASAFGAQMNLSHASLRDDYEVSCPELDAIVEAAWSRPGCFGARMTGAGFGGCAVALVDEEAARDFTAQVAEDYRQRTGRTAAMYVCTPSDGAGLMDF